MLARRDGVDLPANLLDLELKQQGNSAAISPTDCRTSGHKWRGCQRKLGHCAKCATSNLLPLFVKIVKTVVMVLLLPLSSIGIKAKLLENLEFVDPFAC